MINVEKVRQFVHDVDEGLITVQFIPIPAWTNGNGKVIPEITSPQEAYSGNIEYLASNGWKVTIFNDCNEWDYIDSIEIGDECAFKLNDDYNKLAPANEEMWWKRWRIPGYMQYRCEDCGEELSEYTNIN